MLRMPDRIDHSHDSPTRPITIKRDNAGAPLAKLCGNRLFTVVRFVAEVVEKVVR